MASDIEREAARAGRERDVRLLGHVAIRRRRGVVHTPLGLARFVARAADRLVQDELGLAGLSDDRVVVVDPACGPGAFVAAALAVAREAGGAPGLLLGLDVDPAAIAAAREVVGDGRARVRLEARDTLARAWPLGAREGRGRAVVVLGNPPWAGRSAHRDHPLSSKMLEDFRRDELGARLSERKLGVLSDEYVRFFRWAVEIARRAEAGAVIALVTNASFVDGPVHRGMRAALVRWLDRIDIVDLGGGSLVARSRGSDENVFGVRPGVAVTLGVRRAGGHEPRSARVRYASVRGTAREKLAWLEGAELGDARWSVARPRAPTWAFVPVRVDRARASEWSGWPSISELMPFHREGVQTNRDAFVVDRDPERLRARLERFARTGELPRGVATGRSFPADEARARLRQIGDVRTIVRPFDYRPLDTHWVAALTPLCHRPRPDLLAATDLSAFSVVTVQKDRGDRPWAHAAVARNAVDGCYLSVASSCRTRAWPTRGPDAKDNVGPEAVARIERAVRARASGEALARWVLAWICAASYRERYEHLLHLEAPRVPWPESPSDWRAGVRAGDHIVRAFLADDARAPGVGVTGDGVVVRVRPSTRAGVIELGPGARVTGLPDAAVALGLGHVPVVASWLGRRVGEVVSASEVAAVAGRAAAVADALADAERTIAPILAAMRRHGPAAD